MFTNRMMTVGLSVLVLLMVPGLAFARSQPASLGRAVNAEESPCFKMAFSAMIHNGCPTGEPVARNFELPLVIEDAGRHTVRISTKTPLAGGVNIRCWAVGMEKDGRVVSDTGEVANTRFDTAEQIVLRNVHVPTEGYAYAACRVPRNATIFNVVFSRE